MEIKGATRFGSRKDPWNQEAMQEQYQNRTWEWFLDYSQNLSNLQVSSKSALHFPSSDLGVILQISQMFPSSRFETEFQNHSRVRVSNRFSHLSSKVQV